MKQEFNGKKVNKKLQLKATKVWFYFNLNYEEYRNIITNYFSHLNSKTLVS